MTARHLSGRAPDSGLLISQAPKHYGRTVCGCCPDGVHDYARELNAGHPSDCGYCAGGETSAHRYVPASAILLEQIEASTRATTVGLAELAALWPDGEDGALIYALILRRGRHAR